MVLRQPRAFGVLSSASATPNQEVKNSKAGELSFEEGNKYSPLSKGVPSRFLGRRDVYLLTYPQPFPTGREEGLYDSLGRKEILFSTSKRPNRRHNENFAETKEWRADV